MTLTRLVLAWLPVAALFAGLAGLKTTRSVAAPPQSLAPPEPGPGVRRLRVEMALTLGMPVTRWVLLWRSIEAAAVTLFASLWFDSLGHGEWWLLFALVGLLVALSELAGAQRERASTAPGPGQRRGDLARAIVAVARYVLAGAILAWRLG